MASSNSLLAKRKNGSQARAGFFTRRRLLAYTGRRELPRPDDVALSQAKSFTTQTSALHPGPQPARKEGSPREGSFLRLQRHEPTVHSPHKCASPIEWNSSSSSASSVSHCANEEGQRAQPKVSPSTSPSSLVEQPPEGCSLEYHAAPWRAS